MKEALARKFAGASFFLSRVIHSELSASGTCPEVAC
jgi:hypothetical protein